MAVGVDVERVGPDDARHRRVRLVHGLERERAAGLAPVGVQRRRVRAAGDEEVGHPVAVAVEASDAAADEVLPRAVVDVVDPRGERLVDEARHVAVEALRGVAGGRGGCLFGRGPPIDGTRRGGVPRRGGRGVRRRGRGRRRRGRRDDPRAVRVRRDHERAQPRRDVVAPRGVERRPRVAGRARGAAVRVDRLGQGHHVAAVAVRGGRADAPQLRRHEDVALDEALGQQLVAEARDLAVGHRVALQVAEQRHQRAALPVALERPGPRGQREVVLQVRPLAGGAASRPRRAGRGRRTRGSPAAASPGGSPRSRARRSASGRAPRPRATRPGPGHRARAAGRPSRPGARASPATRRAPRRPARRSRRRGRPRRSPSRRSSARRSARRPARRGGGSAR